MSVSEARAELNKAIQLYNDLLEETQDAMRWLEPLEEVDKFTDKDMFEPVSEFDIPQMESLRAAAVDVENAYDDWQDAEDTFQVVVRVTLDITASSKDDAEDAAYESVDAIPFVSDGATVKVREVTVTEVTAE